ncbi:malonyl-CoA decarboxylase domain-containing protein [Thiosocius teredinicola]|uniref:malonyl-CoA decarboxylase domain-containing protein n=1 Tax=Thiosocius teredinicola TaxID=1973002 RepID=UPI000990DBB1
MPGIKWLERITNTVADRGRELLGLRDDEAKNSLSDLCRRLIAGRGEASNIALAREILRLFENTDKDGKDEFFATLAAQFGPDPQGISEASAAFDRDKPATLARLIEAVEPPRQELFRRLNMAPHGTASLVAMRSELLDRLRANPELSSVDADLKHLLASWFNRGFLRLQRIDWHSPAALLEKIMQYESVHSIDGWRDLRRRLADDRRCFGFFHPALPDEPLIFVEVALTGEVTAEIGSLIDPEAQLTDPYAADTAMFYSINNALRGLRGISFGNFLLKQVLSDLGDELPQLKRFVTLSPMPRFAERLNMLLAGDIEDWPRERLDPLLEDFEPALAEHSNQASPSAAVFELLQNFDQHAAALAGPLARLALLYISAMKRSPGVCCDPVAAFHLANGAVLERINVGADKSVKGMTQSYGVMVNYLYDPEQVVANHEAFVQEGRIAMSRALKREHEKHIVGKR